MDFNDIDAVVAPVVAELDHVVLNEVQGLENPTSEHVARWIWQRIAAEMPGLLSVRISETESSSVTYRGE
jgi:6-pyruvoyltetrahydropterin/6-carboxytetrahydropterin synthase